MLRNGPVRVAWWFPVRCFFCLPAPSSHHAQPYPDHYMPLLAALGTAGLGAKGTVIHQGWYCGNLRMGAYEFK
jgi:hypothetical protein